MSNRARQRSARWPWAARPQDAPGRMAGGSAADFPVGTGILFGIGFGGFFDGIVFHQLLQWHHMVSTWYPPDTLVNLRFNTVWDGIFHSFNYVLLVIAVYRLAGSGRLPGRRAWAPRPLGACLLIGWGCFNLVEGVVDHLALGVHHVNETVDVSQRWAWDGGFLVWGAAMLLLGWALLRAGRAGREAPS